MLHRGGRTAGADYFHDFDVAGEREQGGIFGGSLGASEYENIKQGVDPQNGLGVEMSCRACGNRVAIWISWEELYVIGSNGPGVAPVLPPGYAYSENNQTAYPNNIHCPSCGRKDVQGEGTEVIAPHLTPQEAAERVKEAVSQGWIAPQQIEVWKQNLRVSRARVG